jgi:hypothetical protein
MSRILLVLSSLLLAAGGWTHAAAYHRAAAAVAGSDLPAYFGNALKALWLMDSSGMFVLAGVCLFVAIRPAAASGPVLMLLGLIPAATAVLLYVFIGRFFGAHMLFATAVAMVVAGAVAG